MANKYAHMHTCILWCLGVVLVALWLMQLHVINHCTMHEMKQHYWPILL